MWTGDKLPIMHGMNSEFVGLIYLDPPFNRNANYAVHVVVRYAWSIVGDMWSIVTGGRM